MYRIEPLVRRVWNETRGEVEDLPGIYGYCVTDDRGRTIATGESRSEALERASEFMLLPKSPKAKRV